MKCKFPKKIYNSELASPSVRVEDCGQCSSCLAKDRKREFWFGENVVCDVVLGTTDYVIKSISISGGPFRTGGMSVEEIEKILREAFKKINIDQGDKE